jgi:hypothetical protein
MTSLGYLTVGGSADFQPGALTVLTYEGRERDGKYVP